MKRAMWLPVVVCTMILGCNQHPVSYTEALARVEIVKPFDVDPEENLDILWVIDNSGSMCQEQAVLRDNFDEFVDQLDDATLDFHIGVTTTHTDDWWPREPVAVPGHLQSQPQPLAGWDNACFTAVDDDGNPIEGDYTPIRQLIDVAVDCMETPDPSYRQVSDAEIECALHGEPDGCSIPGRCGPGECDREHLFPPLDSARQIPKVLRSADYRGADGSLDVASLKADFACMATVGMRGYGFEKGLGAAVTAVSPELTGGAVGVEDADETAPNYGLIRDDARFAVIFVTDENDCTHDGRLTEQSACGDDSCDFWNHPEADDSPLIDPKLLAEQMVENLKQTKRDPEFPDEDILVASIHGKSKRYDGDVIPGAECLVDDPADDAPAACGAFSVCRDPGYEEVSPTCATALGTAYSGDRYDRFLKSFDEGQYFPEPAAPGEPVFGWMCTDTFRPALSALAEWIKTAELGCITRPVRSCDPDGAACPDFPYSDEPGTCVQRPGGDDWFCDSYVQIRVTPPDDATAERLRASGFCHPASFDDPTNPGGCAVPPSKYTLDACSGIATGLRVVWSDSDEARRALVGTELELRFASY